MTRPRHLHAVPAVDEPQPSVEEELQLALIQHQRALEVVRWVEQDLARLRRRYADARGERMLPTIERLRRELLSQ